MSQQTATVETLTAEVRVLMVGNRQITLSVAKQVDSVGWGDMDPFGRCRLADGVRLIGRSHKTGALVTAALPVLDAYPVIDELTGKVLVSVRGGGGARWVTWHGRTIVLYREAMKYCPDYDCELWHENGNEAEIEQIVAEYDEYAARVKPILELPLIVLAGLK